MTSLDELGGRMVTADEVRARYPGEWWLEVLEHGGTPPPMRLVEQDLAVTSLAPGEEPWGLIIDGDLHATGDLDFSTGDYAVSLLVVRGSLRARNLRFTNGANCIVRGDVEVTGAILGRYGDESARLEVGGDLRARALLLDHVTGCKAASIDAVVRSSPGWQLPMDIEHGDEKDVFVPAALAGDAFSFADAWRLVTGGGELFRPGVYERLRAARPGRFVWPREGG